MKPQNPLRALWSLSFHRPPSTARRATVLSCIILTVAGSVSYGQLAYDRLKSFGIPELSGASPYAPLIESSDGRLYGTTAFTTMSGGPTNSGIVFRLNKDGSGYAVLHGLTGSDGGFPYAGVVEASDGSLYGTASGGGDSGSGTVFKLNKDGSGFTVLHTFSGSDGAYPYAGVVEASDGSLYGTTSQGGDSGFGIVFKLNKDGSGYSVLHSFTGSDGAYPFAGVAEAGDGSLYGTAYQGGDSGFGTMFKLNKDGSGFAVLYSFTGGSDGAYPYAGVVEASDGSLYGTASGGGDSGGGTAFKLNEDGSGFAVLHSFTGGSDGAYPYAGVVESSDGSLYGTTFGGGDSGFGTMFMLNKDGSGFAVLHTFTGSDGAYPYAGVVEAGGGSLYGTTSGGGASGGGASGGGTAFKLNKDGTAFTVLRKFSLSAGDAATPNSVVESSDGSLYGTSYSGGDSYSSFGTLFKLNKDGSGYSVLHSFTGSDGAYPYAGVVEASDGSLYGTSYSGGDSSFGTLFKLNKDGSRFAVLHSFTGGSDGAAPVAGLVEGSDGSLYGTSSYGGDSSFGTLFKLNKDGSGFAVLHSFTGSDGASPIGGVVEASDGSLYGTTGGGGDSGSGTVFKLNKDGSGFAVLHSFSGSDGAYPFAGMAEGSDGSLYGTTTFQGQGGDSSFGTLFKLNKDGSGFAVLHSFTGGSDGATPVAGLVEGSDGSLYGTAEGGGASGGGTAFKLNKDGSGFTVLHSFTGGSDGATPVAGVVEGSDGNFYGTTYSGGDMQLGVIYRLAWTNTPNASVSGGGSIPMTPKVNATFGLTTTVSRSGKASGIVSYQDQSSRITLKSTAITAVTVTGTHGHISGKAAINGAGSYDFVVNVDDLAEPGAYKDKFSIKVSNGYKAGGTVGAKSNINIVVRK